MHPQKPLILIAMVWGILAAAGLAAGNPVPWIGPAAAAPAKAAAAGHPGVVPQALAVYRSPYGTPMYLRGALGPIQSADPVAAAAPFLKANRGLLKLRDEGNDFSLRSVDRDELGLAHVKFQHTYRGIPVWPEEVIVHVNPLGQVYCCNGIFRESPCPTSADGDGGRGLGHRRGGPPVPGGPGVRRAAGGLQLPHRRAPAGLGSRAGTRGPRSRTRCPTTTGSSWTPGRGRS